MAFDTSFFCCLQGMDYLHSRNIVHFDLKTANLLVGYRERQPICKVSDFGLSKRKQQTYVSGEGVLDLGLLVCACSAACTAPFHSNKRTRVGVWCGCTCSAGVTSLRGTLPWIGERRRCCSNAPALP